MKKILNTHKFIFLENRKMFVVLILICALLRVVYSDDLNNKESVGSFIIMSLVFYLILTGMLGISNRRALYYNSPQAKTMNFFNRLPFSRKELFILVITEKFYFYIILSIAYSFLIFQNKPEISTSLFFLSSIFFFIGQNLSVYRMNVFNEVDLKRRTKFQGRLIVVGRFSLMLTTFLGPVIVSVINSFTERSALPILITSIVYLGINLLLHFLFVEDYEFKGRKLSVQLMFQTLPVTISALCLVGLVYLVGRAILETFKISML